jgi:hypothetical protein
MVERRLTNRNFGRKIPLDVGLVGQNQAVLFNDFSGGYNAAVDRGALPLNATPYSIDIEVNRRNRLERVPGTSILVPLDRVVSQIVLQASLDYRSEIVLFAPPHLGYWNGGAVEWVDIGLSDRRRFAWTNFGGSLIFSNRVGGVYVRQPETNTVEQIPGAPVAQTYATFAGRVFAGGAEIEGTNEPLGIMWSAANSNYLDWTSRGAGFELLIDDMVVGDRIISMKPMGLDFMAILCRRSIWIGRRTSLTDRPADIQPRVASVGAVSAATCQSTRMGVVFLSDTGVRIFDGNSDTLISEAINPEILPLDYTNIDSYRSACCPLSQKYFLFTPTGTWVIDLQTGRWHRRSIQAKDSVLYAEQFPRVLWNEMVGAWDVQEDMWADLSPVEADLTRRVYLSANIEVTDPASSTVNGVDLTPIWDLPMQNNPDIGHLNTIKQVAIEYVGEGEADIVLVDETGSFTSSVTVDLPLALEHRLVRQGVMVTGKGTTARLVLRGTVEIISVQLMTMPRDERIDT